MRTNRISVMAVSLLCGFGPAVMAQDPSPEPDPPTAPVTVPAPAPEPPPRPAPFAPLPGRPIGCMLQGVEPEGLGMPRPLKTSGDRALDDRLRDDLGRLAPWFQVHPRFYFMDDGGQGNALSSPMIFGEPDDFPPERSQFGTVLFGITLLRDELRATPPGQPNYTVTAILAHELGHTLQSGRGNPLPVVHKELQADFLAGWSVRYMQRTGGRDVDEAVVFSSFYRKGDFKFNDANHHGTRIERLAAFLAGFKVEDDDVNLAYQKGENYVRNLPIDNGGEPGGNVPQEFYANNLGILYVPIPVGDGTYALKVSRPPHPDSPGGKGGIELGDVILLLDALPFRNEQDVMNHTGRTTISVIDVRTNQRQEGVLELP